MNKKLLYAYKSRVYASQGRVSANLYAEKSQEAYEQIKEITSHYNQQKDGKWMHMMSYNPRELPVFGMPEIGHFEPTQKTAGGIIPEGFSQPIEPDSEKASLPTFLSSTDRQYFIDIFNAGTEPLKWTAKAKDPWVQISKTAGEATAEERIWVSVDWSLIPDNGTETSSISFSIGNSVYNVQVVAQKSDLQDRQQLFVEDNGVIAIEAEHFSEAQNAENSEWKLIQGLGRQNDAVGSFPITAGPLDAPGKQAPSLLYEFFTRSAGEANLLFYCLPSQPINEDYKLRFAVSIDDGKPIVVDASLKEVMNEHNEEWSMNVLRATNITEVKVTIPQPGQHQLKITMIDPGVVLDKIEIVSGEKASTYFGSVETKYSKHQ